MRALLLTLFVLCFTGSAMAARPIPSAKLYAVYAYADWCPNCKILSPKITKAREALAKEPVLFVTLDLTDKTRIHQALLLAQALGLGDWLRAQGSATGYLALLEPVSKKELARFDRDGSADAMVAAITKIVAK